jgi:hypothetical protein
LYFDLLREPPSTWSLIAVHVIVSRYDDLVVAAGLMIVLNIDGNGGCYLAINDGTIATRGPSLLPAVRNPSSADRHVFKAVSKGLEPLIFHARVMANPGDGKLVRDLELKIVFGDPEENVPLSLQRRLLEQFSVSKVGHSPSPE